VENDISAFGRITSNVSESPDTIISRVVQHRKYLRLLTDVKDLRRQESDKVGDGTCLNNYLSVVACTGCNVCLSARNHRALMQWHTGEGPGGLKLQDRVITV